MHSDFKGDFSRIRFDRKNQYVAVVKQQGRVDLDSDDLEQHQIDLSLRNTAAADIIGSYGAPENEAGFQITIPPFFFNAGEVIQIGAGRYYVNGILVEQSGYLYDSQPFLIDPANMTNALLEQLQAAAAGSTLGFLLQVWQRTVTALDDPDMLEPALGQADTTVRLQTVWRVIGTVNPPPVPPSPPFGAGNPISNKAPSCQALYAQTPARSKVGTLTASVAPASSDCGCQPIAPAGYQGLENQLYRVEIHQAASGGKLATFKWSRENASVVVAVTSVSGAVVTVASLGPDANLGFQANQWVELSDDSFLFGRTPNQPGVLCQIQSVNPATLQVTMTASVGVTLNPNLHPRMRRWDQPAASAATGIPVSSTPIALENGIEVSFDGGDYEPGDYWTIPARSAKGQIEWPQSNGNPASVPANYTRVHQAPLACFTLTNEVVPGGAASVEIPVFSDCRLLFPPLNALSPSTPPPALHVTAISWPNDDVMTVDTFLQQGLSITFDSAPTCPWGGGNFKVAFEPPLAADQSNAFTAVKNSLGALSQTTTATDIFLRTSFALDPPQGITTSGKQAVWLPPLTSKNQANDAALWFALNVLLNAANPAGYGRVRVRLDGGAVYGAGGAGAIYLDGQTFGSTGTRSSDGSSCVSLSLPSGNAGKVSNFESWFYLAPTPVIQSVVIQGVELTGGQAITINSVTYTVTNPVRTFAPLAARSADATEGAHVMDDRAAINPDGPGAGVTVGPVTGIGVLRTTVSIATGTTPPISLSSVQAVITLSYPPIANTTVSLSFSTPAGGGGTGALAISATATVPAGQSAVTVPITLQNLQAMAATVYTLNAAIGTAIQNLPYGPSPTLTVTVSG